MSVRAAAATRASRGRLVLPSGPASLASRFRIAVAAALLGVYLAVVLLVTLTPTPVDRPFRGSLARLIQELHERGVPQWIGYTQIESASNVLLFVPLGFLAALVLPRRDWWLVAVLTPAFSAILETAQAVFLPGRYASAADVVANGIGGALGAGVSLLARMLVHRRDRLVAADVVAKRRSVLAPVGAPRTRSARGGVSSRGSVRSPGRNAE